MIQRMLKHVPKRIITFIDLAAIVKTFLLRTSLLLYLHLV